LPIPASAIQSSGISNSQGKFGIKYRIRYVPRKIAPDEGIEPRV
jgi:hypothetical protein